MKCWHVGVLAIALTIYLLLGALGFHLIEQPAETNTRTVQLEKIANFLANNSCVNAVEFTELLERVISAYDAGVLVIGNKTSESNWHYGSAIFFSLTIVTTIGYGHVSPATAGGRILCVFYALIGIPLCGLFLAQLGIKMNRVLKRFIDWKCTKSWSNLERRLKIGLCWVIGLLIWLFLPAAAFAAVERWSYAEALYYCVITLTTIGFGDYVPGQNRDNPYGVTYKVVSCVWILLGAAWLAMLIGKAIDSLTALPKKINPETQKEKGAAENDKQELNNRDGESQPSPKMDVVHL